MLLGDDPCPIPNTESKNQRSLVVIASLSGFVARSRKDYQRGAGVRDGTVTTRTLANGAGCVRQSTRPPLHQMS